MRKIIFVGSALLAACTQQPAEQNQLTNIAGEEAPGPEGAQPQESPPPVAPEPRSPAISTGNAGDIVSEEPFAPTSAQGAANVVQTYYALIEAKKYSEAHKLWTTGTGDLADATFAAQFDRYREYHAEVLAPGRIEGAAGSLYVEVPVRTYGVTKDGKRFEEPAVVTLRRVNDVPGSTAEQRRWHIMKIDSPPEPH